MKFLFFVTDFDTGGITSSLRNLTSVLCDKEHEVHILNLAKVNELPSDFDKRIKLIQLDKRATLWNLSGNDVKNARGIKKIRLLFLGFIKKLMNRGEGWMNYAFKNISFEGYDAVIGFRQSPVCFYLASRKTKGGKKCGFWHVDLDYAGNIKGWDYFLSELDGVACVSNALRDSMSLCYPSLDGKLFTVYNIFDEEKIQEMSLGDTCHYDDKIFNIVTVSRVEFEQKQLQFIPEVCKKLKKDGFSLRWNIVGDGPHMARLKSLIVENGVEDMVELHGRKNNPFPYLKEASLFVLTSLWETYGMVVVESLICHTPVVACDYPALKEILSDGENGLIAENSSDGIYEALVRVLSDRELYERLKSGAEKYEYTPDLAYNQFMEMVK